MKKDRFVFYRPWYEAALNLPGPQRLDFYDRLIRIELLEINDHTGVDEAVTAMMVLAGEIAELEEWSRVPDISSKK